MNILTNNFMSFIVLSGNTINTKINNVNNEMSKPENIKKISEG